MYVSLVPHLIHEIILDDVCTFEDLFGDNNVSDGFANKPVCTLLFLSLYYSLSLSLRLRPFARVGEINTLIPIIDRCDYSEIVSLAGQSC